MFQNFFNLKVMTAFVFLSLAACEQASTTLVGVPDVSIECVATDNASCNAGISGNDVFVTMTRSGCDNIDFEPVAGGSARLNCDGSGCTGAVSSWVDSNGNSVTEIITGRMDLCSFIDIDNSGGGEANSGDLVKESSESIQSGQTILIDSWSAL